NVHEHRLRADYPPDGTNHVDIVNPFPSRDVVTPALFAPLQAGQDDAAKIHHIQGLPHKASRPWNREHGYTLHEAREPAQVLAIKSAEHQRRPQNGGCKTARDDNRLLLLLGFRVRIADDRLGY